MLCVSDTSQDLSMKNTLALMAVCLAALMSGLEISSVPVLSPVLEQELHASFRELQWIMNAYTLACTTVLMATGTLADRYGRKRVFIISIVAFGLTSLMCGLASSSQWLIAGRFAQGLSGGAMLTCLIAILSSQFPQGKARSQAFAAWGITFGFGLGFGPIIGGMLVAWLSWRWVFLVHVFIAVLTLILALKNVVESRDAQAKKLDLGGLITLSVTVMGSTFLITQGSSLGWNSAIARAVLLATTISAAMFIWIEKRHPHPMFDFSVFRVRAFSGALMGSVGMNFSFWPLMIYLPVYYQSGLGYDSVTTGLALLAYTLPTLLMPPLGEKLTTRFGASRLIPLGLTNTPVTNTTTGSVAANRAGMASGIDISARLITLAVNIALMGSLLVAGIAASLKKVMPAAGDLSSLAERIAGGSVVEGLQSARIAQALTDGFAVILIYGAAGVWILAIMSYLLFNVKGRRKTVTCEPY